MKIRANVVSYDDYRINKIVKQLQEELDISYKSAAFTVNLHYRTYIEEIANDNGDAPIPDWEVIENLSRYALSTSYL